MSLTRITSEQATTKAMNRLRKGFRDRGIRQKRDIGYPGGYQSNVDIFAIDDLNVWMAYIKMEAMNRYWCSFGTLPLPKTGSLSITVEINPPLSGINRRLAGFFASDGQGTQYLCHTGRIGGGQKGVGQRNFLNWFNRKPIPVNDTDGRSTLAFPVAQIGSARLVEQIAEFAWKVKKFKDIRSASKTTKTTTTFGGADEEFEGSKNVSALSGYMSYCDHGIIRNRLADLIAATGRTVDRDQPRDLLVGKSDPLDVEFEIKTSADSQSIFTAVGQLLLHNYERPANRLVAVLPDPIAQKKRKAIESLDIDVVTYRWTTTQIQFNGLDKIIPGVESTAPISKRK